jgi:hypothetical protein|tara:strand:- start:95 stop:403 length:309 start_codon:yes stop_codon:yes gene_type:complete
LLTVVVAVPTPAVIATPEGLIVSGEFHGPDPQVPLPQPVIEDIAYAAQKIMLLSYSNVSSVNNAVYLPVRPIAVWVQGIYLLCYLAGAQASFMHFRYDFPPV